MLAARTTLRDATSARDAASTILNDLREKGLIATGGACRGLLGYF
jgi:hypothetical protein